MHTAENIANFIKFLQEPAAFSEFRLIDHEGNVKRQFKDRSDLGLGKLDQLVDSAESHNVFYSVVPRVREAGTRDACGPANAVWCDYDNADVLPTWKLQPSATVKTSPGKFQVYWLLESPLEDLDLLESLNHSIAIAEGGDLQAIDRARVLRLPGSRNWKYPDGPLVELDLWDPLQRFSLDGLKHCYPPVERLVEARRGRALKPVRTPTWLSVVFDALIDHLERGGFRPRIRGEHVLVLCPLHDDRQPSLSIHSERGWKCFAGCGQGRLTRLANILGVQV